ncbi:hypothetical protein ASE33_25560 [Pseudomonas sp. Root9]|uniref:hypothetical protein n=1 Tax=Pseudomonas sp. Root9 TaxID=1736604 RepID=UPI0006FFC7BB|nr:hypothetical protein [Pseudomonas sp. Root9]KRC96592.1 hypothetical protein ASE33_25560 [Pseudomonas sp. Root9]MBJ7435736.1 hypothetical protein [Acinetobacter sp.]
MMKNVLFPKTREEKLLSDQYFSKTAKVTKPAEPVVAVNPKLSDEEIQMYVDMLLEASKPTEPVDHTKEILLKRFPKQE